MQSVIVTLRDQADLGAIQGQRPSRLNRVITTLRAKSDATQWRLRALLTTRRLQGRVASVTHFWVFNGLAVTATQDVVNELRARPEVLSVVPDIAVSGGSASLATLAGAPEPGVARVNAPALWDKGFRGQGVVIASMDSGVDLGHPDLAGRWRGGTNSWYDPNGEHPASPFDASGHGTWTTGIMVGGDAGGTAIGIAPEARWIAVKIFNDRGSASLSRIHMGFQWLLDPDGNPATADAPHLVNNSWGFSSPGCKLEFQRDLQSLRAAGILPIFSAGNTGPGSSTSTSPANNPEAFAVGATSATDAIYPYSARGPSACGETSRTFPEIVAPGVNVRTSDLFGGYYAASGTSFAAPAAAGVLALLLDAYPSLTLSQQEAALESAVDLGTPGPDNTFGSGRLDALAAYDSIAPPPPPSPDFTVAATPASASVQAGDTAAYTVTVSSANGFAGEVTLSAAGLPAGQGTWSFAPGTIGGGAGAAELTVTTAVTLAPGSYPLTITGTSGALSRSAPVTIVVDPPPPSPDFGLVVSPATVGVAQGGAAAASVTVTSVGGFAADVLLTADGLPGGVTASFSPGTVSGGSGTSQLTVAASSATPVGSYVLTITGKSASIVRTASLTLVVAPPADFGLGVSPASAQAQAGRSAAYTITVSALGGFGGTVALSVSGLPAGASAELAPSAVTGSGTSRLIVTTSTATPVASYTLTVTGTSGSLARSATTLLAVAPAPSLVTVYPTGTTVLYGSTRSGSASALRADDGSFYEVNGRGWFGYASSWYASFTGVPNGLASLEVTYSGKNSRTCTQTVAIWRWTDSTWVQIDSRSVGTTEVSIADLAPPGSPADYVSGATGLGETRVRIGCTGSIFGFYASGDVMRLVYG